MSKKRRITTIMLFTGILISIFTTSSFSQSEVNREINSCRIEGIVSGVYENFLQLSNGAIEIDISGATINGNITYSLGEGKNLPVTGGVSLSSLVPGAHVTVYSNYDNDKYFQPYMVGINLSPKEGHISGKILNVNYPAKTLNIFSEKVLISDKTAIQNFEEQHKAIKFSNLEANKHASMDVMIEEKGVVAREIVQFSDGVGIHISSPITEVNQDTIKLLNNFSISTKGLIVKSSLEPATQCKSVDFNSLKKGMLVSIFTNQIKYDSKGNVNLDGEKIYINLSDEGVIEGFPQEISTENKTVKIGNQEVFFNAQTLITKDKQRSLFENLSVEKKIFLIYKVMDGKLVARHVQFINNASSLQGSNPCSL